MLASGQEAEVNTTFLAETQKSIMWQSNSALSSLFSVVCYWSILFLPQLVKEKHTIYLNADRILNDLQSHSLLEEMRSS